MACDLHVHSSFSDGTDSPQRLIQIAEALGLSAVALCDHNTVDGLAEFLHAADSSSVTAIPGIEFSSDYEGVELHMLALYVRPEHYDEIREFLDVPRQKKEISNRALAEKLKNAGFLIDYEAIREKSKGYVSRAHFAQALTEKGYVSSVEEAFKTLLRSGGGFYDPPLRWSALDVLRFINGIDAVSVLAHPFLSADEKTLRRFLTEAVPLGLDAMETEYATYDEETARTAGKIAEEAGLLPSGGSDYHGIHKNGIFMGVGEGNLQVPESYWKNLQRRAEKKRGKKQ